MKHEKNKPPYLVKEPREALEARMRAVLKTMSPEEKEDLCFYMETMVRTGKPLPEAGLKTTRIRELSRGIKAAESIEAIERHKARMIRLNTRRVWQN